MVKDNTKSKGICFLRILQSEGEAVLLEKFTSESSYS